MVSGWFRARRAVGVALFVLVFSGLAAERASAQLLRGQVLRDADGVPGVAVELHRVTRSSAGIIGATTTDRAGGFSFSLPVAEDTSFTVIFATAEYLGVRYFGAPLHPDDPIAVYSIAVYDTVAAATAQGTLRVPRRDVILLPERTGGWEVNEMLQLRNPSNRTLVAEAGMPTWEFRIPAPAVDFQMGEGELSASELVRVDDRVLLLAPLPPGGREVLVRYRIPHTSRELRLPLAGADELNLFVQQPAPALRGEGLSAPEVVRAEGGEFLRYRGAAVGPELVVAWSRVGPPVDPTAAALAVVGLFLLVGVGAALSNRRAQTPGPRQPAPGIAEQDPPPAAAGAVQVPPLS